MMIVYVTQHGVPHLAPDYTDDPDLETLCGRKFQWALGARHADLSKSNLLRKYGLCPICMHNAWVKS